MLKNVAKKSSLIAANFFQKKINKHLNKMHSAKPNGIHNIRLLLKKKINVVTFPIGPKSDLISKMVDQIKDVKVKSKQLNEEI